MQYLRDCVSWMLIIRRDRLNGLLGIGIELVPGTISGSDAVFPSKRVPDGRKPFEHPSSGKLHCHLWPRLQAPVRDYQQLAKWL